MKGKFVAVIAVVLLSACATAPERFDTDQTLERYQHYAGEPIDGFTSFDGPKWWEALARDKIVLWNSVNEAYLVTVWDTCPDMMFSHAIRVSSSGNQVTLFDKVHVNRDRCPIKEIRPIDVRRMKQERKDMKAPQKAE